jgi:hypothetical protein
MSRCSLTNEVWNSKKSWTYIQVLYGSLLCLTKLLNLAMVRNFQVMLRQTLNHCVEL